MRPPHPLPGSHPLSPAIPRERGEGLSYPLPRDPGVAAPEQVGRDRFLAIQEEERARIAALEVLLYPIGLVGVKKGQTWLSGDGVAQQRPELLVTDEVDELVRIGERVAMVRSEQDERVAGRARG